MSTDQQITADLAVVARASRERPFSLDETLRAVGALPASPRAAAGRIELSLVAMSRVFAMRVARITASTFMLAVVTAILAYCAVPLDSWDDWGHLDHLLFEDPTNLIVKLLWATALVYLAALQLAVTAFRRAMETAADALVRGRQLVHRTDGWSVALTIAAMTGFVVVFRMSRLVLGNDGLIVMHDVLYDPTWLPLHPMWNLVPLAATTLAGVVGGFAIARSLRRAWVVRGWIVLLASAVAFAMLVIGNQYDLDSIQVGERPAPHVIRSPALRVSLLVTSGLATFTLASCYILARRRREHAAIESEELP